MISINYTKRFYQKAEIPQYPIKGYWIQLGQKNPNYDKFNEWYQSASDIYACNTFIHNNQLRISFDISQSSNLTDISNSTQLIYLIAIDKLVYSDITDLAGSKDPRLFTQIAAIIDLGIDSDSVSQVINKKVTDIIDLQYLPKCSFELNYADKQVQVQHYNSDYVGKSLIYDEKLKDEMLIDKESAYDYLRGNLSANKPEYLLGTMTICKSGIIQL